MAGKVEGEGEKRRRSKYDNGASFSQVECFMKVGIEVEKLVISVCNFK